MDKSEMICGMGIWMIFFCFLDTQGKITLSFLTFVTLFLYGAAKLCISIYRHFEKKRKRKLDISLALRRRR